MAAQRFHLMKRFCLHRYRDRLQGLSRGKFEGGTTESDQTWKKWLKVLTRCLLTKAAGVLSLGFVGVRQPSLNSISVCLKHF